MGKGKVSMGSKTVRILFVFFCLIGHSSFSQSGVNPEESIIYRLQSYDVIWVSVGGKLALCSSTEKGSITLTVGGGKPPYSFRWNTNETTQNRSNLNAGTYTVWIKDSEGREHQERIVIQPPFPLILNPLIKKDATCGSSKNGYAKISVKTGRNEYEKDSPPYSVTWSNGLKNVWEADQLAPGTYVVTVADKYHCETSISFEIKSETDGITVKENIKQAACKGQTGGEIILDVAGGQGPFTYQWSNGFSGKNLTGVAEGIYEVTIKDSRGCSFHGSYRISSSREIQLGETITMPTCPSSRDGMIRLNPSGGIPPYSISWSDGSAQLTAQNLGDGRVKVNITDAAGCTLEKEFELKAQSPLGVSLLKLEPVTCFGGTDGKVVLNVSGVQGALKILWSDGGAGLERKNLKAGTYHVQISDESTCQVSLEVQVKEPDPIQAKIEHTLERDCDLGVYKGRAWVTVSGGKAPYTYHWLGSTVSAKEIPFQQGGTLKVKVTDALGCSTEIQAEVTFPEQQTGLGDQVDFDFRKLEETDETEITVDEALIFESGISKEFIFWEWDFGDGQKSSDKSPIHAYKQAGTYEIKLSATDSYGCALTQKNLLTVVSPEELLIIPNAFSPNGDKLNDFFLPKMKGIKEFRLQIFNGWGELLHTMTDPESSGWDGTYQGQLAQTGNYIYKIDYINKEGIKKSLSGTLSLIR
jgi:gliding motility-associated-like protein